MNQHWRKHPLTLATLLTVGSIVAASDGRAADHPPASAAMTAVERKLDEQRDALIAFRRDLHRHPEVSGEEKRTARVVAERLRALGLDVRTGVGGHGVVATVAGAHPGPLVAMRADMDAVPSAAPDPVEFKSENPGVRHICGHDVHTTIAVAVAEAMAAIRDEMRGSVRFYFQPAEENATGARAMIADGALEGPKPGAIFAFHTAPLVTGQIGTKSGVMLAGRDMIEVTLSGEGDLEAAAKVTAEAIGSLSTIGPEKFVQSLAEDFFIAQVLPPSRDSDTGWTLRAQATTTLDSLRQDARARLRSRLDQGLPEGVDFGIEYQALALAGVDNDAEIEAWSRAVIRNEIGDENLVPLQGVIPAFSEDFGSFQQAIPGAMFFLGVSNPEKGIVGMPHSPDYVADEEAIFVGAKTMAALMLAYLEKHRED